MEFSQACKELFEEIGTHKKMVLSTALNQRVTSRMMSIIVRGGKFYFQTDRTSRKYLQLKGNCHAALCIDNLQVEGVCTELGHPTADKEFCEAYKQCFASSYSRYSGLECERLFEMSPTFIERWRYVNGVPYLETFDLAQEQYQLEAYAAT